jgi:hypothetical protein
VHFPFVQVRIGGDKLKHVDLLPDADVGQVCVEYEIVGSGISLSVVLFFLERGQK